MNPFTVGRYGRTRFWEMRGADGELVCVCVYKRGALEVARRLHRPAVDSDSVLRDEPATRPAKTTGSAIP